MPICCVLQRAAWSGDFAGPMCVAIRRELVGPSRLGLAASVVWPARLRPPYCAARRRNAYAASSMAKIAVSGWLIGSTPTRLTIEVIVPSASASTQAARCSSPK
jgi:hypothetical protein